MKSLGTHVPRRPDWHCQSDGFDWPCPVAQARLLEEYAQRPGDLGAGMTGWMEEAIAERLTDDPTVLWSRFLEWACRRQPQP